MGINKVQYGNTVLLDLTSDTVTADKLMQGYTAHDRTGALITGTATGGIDGDNLAYGIVASNVVGLAVVGTAVIGSESMVGSSAVGSAIYEPTTWVNGDVITATKMNNIESGVQSVSSNYTPTTWVNGDIITAQKMNNIEQGIANAGGGGGSSDFSTATVTVTGEMSLPPKVLHPTVATLSEDGDVSMGIADWIIGETFNVILYKGKAWLYEDSGNLTIPSGETNITYDSSEEAYLITGDCTITIS